jgi:hypothetical protein
MVLTDLPKIAKNLSIVICMEAPVRLGILMAQDNRDLRSANVAKQLFDSPREDKTVSISQ